MFFRSVVNPTDGAKDTGDQFICNLRIFGIEFFVLLPFTTGFTNRTPVTTGLVGTIRMPKAAEKIVEGTHTRRVVLGKSA